MQHYSFLVDGLLTGGCIERIEAAGLAVAGVAELKVDYATATLQVAVESDDTLPVLISSLRRIGYLLKPIGDVTTTDLELSEPDSDQLRNRVRELLGNLTGVTKVAFRSHSRAVRVTHAVTTSAVTLVCALNNSGLSGRLADHETHVYEPTLADGLVVLSGVLVFFGAVSQAFLPGMYELSVGAYALALALNAWPLFYRGLYLPIINRRIESSLVVLIVIVTAAAVGLWMEASLLAACFGVLQFIERRAVQLVRDAHRGLFRMMPVVARLWQNGVALTIDVKELRKGDVVSLSAGECVAVDGVVVEGRATLDSNGLHSEKRNINVTSNMMVSAGYRVLEGEIRVRVERALAESVLSTAVVGLALGYKKCAPIAQRLSGISQAFAYLLLACGIGVIVASLFPEWSGVSADWTERGLGLVLIAGAAPLLLAASLIFSSAGATMLRWGVWVKDPMFWLKLYKTKTVVIDKAGVVTFDRPEVQEVVALQGSQVKSLLKIAATLASLRDSLRFRAVLDRAQMQGIQSESGKNGELTTDGGVVATINGERFALGPYRTIQSLGLDTAQVEAKLGRWEAEGAHSLLLANDSRVLAIITLQDTVRPLAATIVDALHNAGVDRVALLTDENSWATASLAERFGFDEAKGELEGDEKRAYVNRLVSEHGADGFLWVSNSSVPIDLVAHPLRVTTDAMSQPTRLIDSDVAVLSGNIRGISSAVSYAKQVVPRVYSVAAGYAFYKVVMIAAVLMGGLGLPSVALLEVVSVYVVFSVSLGLLDYAPEATPAEVPVQIKPESKSGREPPRGHVRRMAAGSKASHGV